MRPLLAHPADPDVLTEEATEVTHEASLDRLWRVIVFNDDEHTFDEVIVQLMRATGCSAARAEQHAWTIHTQGRDRVFEGDVEECLRVQDVLREIELITQIEG